VRLPLCSERAGDGETAGRARETLELVRIPDRDLRTELLDLIRRLGNPDAVEPPPLPAGFTKSG
jgi:hypothetical protein